MTRILAVDPEAPQIEAIEQAAAEILSGGLVAFPTETVYGLGANSLDPQAVARIFIAKGRPATDPLIVHLASADDLAGVAHSVPPIVQTLSRIFWPGPLTLILPKQRAVPANVSAGLETVAVRVPSNPIAQALLRACGVPIAAPSANRFGSVSPTTAQHVLADLGDLVDLILDGGPTPIGVESTVLDVTNTPWRILRPGGITREALEAVIGPVAVYGEAAREAASSSAAQPSPGLMAKHYAPRAELWLVISADIAQAAADMGRLARLHLAEGRQVGLLLADEDRPFFDDLPARVFTLGPVGDLEAIARRLYAGLRSLDEQGVEVILARDFGEQGLGLAIRDRLRRAASRIIASGSPGQRPSGRQ